MALVENVSNEELPLTVGHLAEGEQANVDVEWETEARYLDDGLLEIVDDSEPPLPPLTLQMPVYALIAYDPSPPVIQLDLGAANLEEPVPVAILDQPNTFFGAQKIVSTVAVAMNNTGFTIPPGTPSVETDQYGNFFVGPNELRPVPVTGSLNKCAPDGMYHAASRRWLDRSRYSTEVGDPVDDWLRRAGPDNSYPLGVDGTVNGFTGARQGENLGTRRWSGALATGTDVDATGASFQNTSASVFARAEQDFITEPAVETTLANTVTYEGEPGLGFDVPLELTDATGFAPDGQVSLQLLKTFDADADPESELASEITLGGPAQTIVLDGNLGAYAQTNGRLVIDPDGAREIVNYLTLNALTGEVTGLTGGTGTFPAGTVVARRVTKTDFGVSYTSIDGVLVVEAVAGETDPDPGTVFDEGTIVRQTWRKTGTSLRFEAVPLDHFKPVLGMTLIATTRGLILGVGVDEAHPNSPVELHHKAIHVGGEVRARGGNFVAAHGDYMVTIGDLGNVAGIALGNGGNGEPGPYQITVPGTANAGSVRTFEVTHAIRSIGVALHTPAAGDERVLANFSPRLNRLVDTSLPGYGLFFGNAADALVFKRAPATAGEPAWADMLKLTTGGVLSVNVAGTLVKVPNVTQTAPQMPALLTPMLLKDLTASGTNAGTANRLNVARYIVSRDGTISNVSIWVRSSAGGGNIIGAIYDTGDAAAGFRTRLWKGSTTVIAGTDAWLSLGNPALAVTAGQQIEIGFVPSEATSTFAKGPTLANNSIATLPTGYLPAAGGASPKLTARRDVGSFDAPTSISEANMDGAAGSPFLVIAHVT